MELETIWKPKELQKKLKLVKYLYSAALIKLIGLQMCGGDQQTTSFTLTLLFNYHCKKFS